MPLRGLKYKTSTYMDKPMTCVYCKKAILPGDKYRFSPTDKCFMHKTCYEQK